jgi:hypothetical protein
MLHLRIGEDLIDRVNGPGWYASFVETIDPVGAGPISEVIVDLDTERIAILRSRFRRFIVWLVHERGGADLFAKPLPGFLAGRGDIDVAVFGLENAGRNAGRMIIAGLFGNFALDQIARALEVEHENLRLQERGLDVLTLFGFLALQQSNKNADRGEQPRGQIGNRDAGTDWPLPR